MFWRAILSTRREPPDWIAQLSVSALDADVAPLADEHMYPPRPQMHASDAVQLSRFLLRQGQMWISF